MKTKFSTYFLDATIEDKKKKGEDLRVRLIEKVFNALNKLSIEIPFKEAYLFGSIVKQGRFMKDSDIDIGFLGLKDYNFFKAMSFISSEVGVDVDIVQLEGHRLKNKVKKEGIRWIRED
ncbi:MAG: nucleotidyltransferase domain-containing protein [bacterium]